MKSISRIILPLVVLLLAIACKNQKVDYDTFSLQDETVQASANRVNITGSYSFTGYVGNMKINIGENENLTDARQYPVQLIDKDYSVTVDSLHPNTRYYYCYSIDFGMKEDYLTETSSFMTFEAHTPTVHIIEIRAIDSTLFRVKCKVSDDGGLPLMEKGICWNTSGNPSLSDSIVKYSDNQPGEYICLMEGLEYNTVYYVNAYARNESKTGFGEPKSFKTGILPAVPTVITGDAEVSIDSVVCHGEVTDEGTSPVTERGICWFTQHNPTIDGYHDSIAGGIGEFSVTIENLTPNQTYYYRAYAINDVDIKYGEEKSFTTLPETERYNIIVSANNNEWGSVSGGGVYEVGETCTIRATANDGYVFVNWEENNTVVSEGAEFSFTVERDRTLVATFDAIVAILPTVSTSPVINITANDAYCGGEIIDDGGSMILHKGVCWSLFENPTIDNDSYTDDGTGNEPFVSHITNLQENTEYHVRAYATNDVGTSYGEDLTFLTSSSTPTPPEGIVNGRFTVGENTVVYFSKGNLQYVGSNGNAYWKFADNQWDYLSTSTNQQSSNTNVNRDLFGWGTSGNNHNNACYQPWSTEQVDSKYYAYGQSQYNLNDQSGQADWGYNAINNGGNQQNKWRTLTKDEWKYVFNEREASTVNGVQNARYAKAIVNGKAGVILLPDNYTHPSGMTALSNINNPAADFSTNNYGISAWTLMEANGCVFLPTAGNRLGTTVAGYGEKGYYWSSSAAGNNTASGVFFNTSNCNPDFGSSRSSGLSVRLVYPVE